MDRGPKERRDLVVHAPAYAYYGAGIFFRPLGVDEYTALLGVLIFIYKFSRILGRCFKELLDPVEFQIAVQRLRTRECERR